MSFNGSGSFLINTAGQPVVSGTVISSTAFNALTADLATGLSTCITKDGQTTVTANIPMANYKFTGLGAGSAAADSANLSQVQSTVVKLLASVSGTDTITAVGSPTVAAYAAGQMFYFVAAGDNTGAVTINIDSLGAKNVTRDGSVALEAGDIKSGEVVVIVYDGTRFQVVSQLNSSGDARFANVSIASALNVGGVATVTGGSVLNGGVVINEPGADVDFRVEGDTDANLIFADASADKVGIGTSSPTHKLQVSGSGRFGSMSTGPGLLSGSSDTFQVGLNQDNTNTTNTQVWAEYVNGASSASWAIRYRTANDTGTASTRLYLNAAAGSLGIGTTSPGVFGVSSRNITVTAASGYSYLQLQGASGNGGAIDFGDNSVRHAEIASLSGSALAFYTNGSNSGNTITERARITSGGDFCVGKTSDALGTAGTAIASTGAIGATASAIPVINVNRLTDDGVLINFYQATTVEGNISVSGNTVSYNAFAGSHWSQLQDGSKPDILRGTVMESINELCVWPGEQNERLPKSKISDTAGSKKVYGVFMAWDNDWTTTNDMYVTAVGAFICRVNGSVTVQEGDLLESNGDGTARVQADDIIRSSTIGKVTSTVKTHEYDDGSYCVPTVLYCG